MTDKIEINILYDSKNRGEISFTDIANQNNSMDSEDYKPESFWGLTGGFQVTIDDYKTIFSSTDFHYLVKATSFLIHSMYWIKDKKSEWFDTDDTFPNDVIVKSTDNNLIRLQKYTDAKLEFSYVSTKQNYIRKRGDRFFEGLMIDKQEWFRQTNIALKEYFDTLLFVSNKAENDKTSKVMSEYYDLWKAISNGN